MVALQLQLDMLPLLLLLLWGMKEVEGGADAIEGYSLDVEKIVVVQEGLCIHVPCKFTYRKEKWTDSDPVHGYWFRDGADTRQDPPVATNNPKRPALHSTRDRFFLLGEPLKNSCSLEIRETRKDDAGSYFFRLERGEAVFNYKLNMMTLQVTGQAGLAEKPPGKAMGATGQVWGRTPSWEQWV